MLYQADIQRSINCWI